MAQELKVPKNAKSLTEEEMMQTNGGGWLVPEQYKPCVKAGFWSGVSLATRGKIKNKNTLGYYGQCLKN